MMSSFCPHTDSTSPVWICSLSWILIFLSWFIFTPIICYYGYKFYENRCHPGIRSRHPSVTGVMILVCLWFTCFAIPIRFIEGTIHLFREDASFGYVTLLFSISILAFSYTGICRIWLLYFDICWLHEMGHNDWSKILNPNQKISFFLASKQTWGNDKYIGKWLIILFIILCILYVITMKLNPYGYIWNILILLCNIPPFCGLFILFFKTPTLMDIFYVRYETKSWILLSTYILFICLICGPLFALYSDTKFNVYIQFIFTTSFYVLCIGIPVSSLYLVLHWVVFSGDIGDYQQIDIFGPPRVVLRAKSKSQTSRQDKRSISVISPKYSRNQSLLALLSDAEGINAFMMHLKREFAIENLCGLIEIFQFLKVVQKHLDIDDKKLNQCRLILANNVPTSQINASNENWRMRLMLLYKKYVAEDSPYQLNLPYGLNNNFISLVYKQIHLSSTNINDKELMKSVVFPILMQIMDETIKLLNDSLQRFRLTPEYAKFEMLFDKSDTMNNYNISDNESDGEQQKQIKKYNNNNNNNNKSPIIIIETPPISSIAGNSSTTIPLQLPSFKRVNDKSNESNNGSIENIENIENHIDDNTSSQEIEVPSLNHHNDNDNNNNNVIPITDDDEDDEDENNFVVLQDLDDPNFNLS